MVALTGGGSECWKGLGWIFTEGFGAVKSPATLYWWYPALKIYLPSSRRLRSWL